MTIAEKMQKGFRAEEGAHLLGGTTNTDKESTRRKHETKEEEGTLSMHLTHMVSSALCNLIFQTKGWQDA